MSVYLAGVALPDPVAGIRTPYERSTVHTMADGTPDVSYSGAEPFSWSWPVEWGCVTQQEVNLICEVLKVARTNAVSWVGPNSTATYTVKAPELPRVTTDGFLRQKVTCLLVEV